MPMVGPSATCTRHPLREAVGVCVRCSQALCSDCITKLDGINHCQACLAELARPTAPKPARAPREVPETLALTFGFAVLAVLAWFMLEVLLPGSGSL